MISLAVFDLSTSIGLKFLIADLHPLYNAKALPNFQKTFFAAEQNG